MALLGKDPRVHSRTWEQFMAKSYQENRETYSYKEVNAANNLSELGSGFFPSSASRWGHRLTDTFSSVQSLSHAWLFATPWTVACQASLSISNSRSLLKSHVHWVDDAIQPSHPLSSPSPPAFSLSKNQGLSQFQPSGYAQSLSRDPV